MTKTKGKQEKQKLPEIKNNCNIYFSMALELVQKRVVAFIFPWLQYEDAPIYSHVTTLG